MQDFSMPPHYNRCAAPVCAWCGQKCVYFLSHMDGWAWSGVHEMLCDVCLNAYLITNVKYAARERERKRGRGGEKRSEREKDNIQIS